MDIDLTELDSSSIYHLMTQTIIPRPIAWVLSSSRKNVLNLAPFSYFTAISSKPPTLMISVGDRPDGTPKDTQANIETGQYFVVHIASADLAQSLNQSAAPYPPSISEVCELQLETTEFVDFPLPRLADCKVAFGCYLADKHRYQQASQTLIFGEIQRVYIADGCLESSTKKLKIDATKIDPLARLGANEYAEIGPIKTIDRPKMPK